MRIPHHEVVIEVLGPWSLETSRIFWEGFEPTALNPAPDNQQLHTTFCAEADWLPVEVTVVQEGSSARMRLSGHGDLEAAAVQATRFLSLDIDARRWPEVALRDPVIAEAQSLIPGLRPCGFHSPYEAATWAVLSQRIRVVQAARLRTDIIHRHGENGTFPPPEVLRDLDLDLPGRKPEYLKAVAEAALDGVLDGAALRAVEPEEAVRQVQEVKGLGSFSSELVVVRGANAPDFLPKHERRLEAEIAERYGDARSLTEVAEAWRPFRSWAAVHLRTLREERTREIGGVRR
ncbi:DNA-3-methyladenine glycosylase 2 family protein [Paeniglutamicibacter gangotriensis]|uniref:DNA-3-methyladenine glycosylase 2 family protein n=1 Tax=Paeniglutamicibacter gangotriensis TaxID=254787 RepID=A0A5B0E9N3_9MICC|nr:DNA-3-methyladenine glycosylase [Paeniglutamicibacter gangotriensis]KAA0974440.1 DNA-3-methyladenine glycosylase 2 family protein [Paeniglutamicibacter gangotriensis]